MTCSTIPEEIFANGRQFVGERRRFGERTCSRIGAFLCNLLHLSGAGRRSGYWFQEVFVQGHLIWVFILLHDVTLGTDLWTLSLYNTVFLPADICKKKDRRWSPLVRHVWCPSASQVSLRCSGDPFVLSVLRGTPRSLQEFHWSRTWHLWSSRALWSLILRPFKAEPVANLIPSEGRDNVSENKCFWT